MIDPILKLIKALNSDVGPWQIACAGAMAMVIGLTPLWSLHNLLVLLFAFIFRVHLATFFVFWGVFSGLAYLLDPSFHQLGMSMLTNPSLESFWTSLYQSDTWQATRFNHSITLGSLIVALIAFIPTAVFFRLSVNRYRTQVMPVVARLKIVQMLKGTKLYELYERVGE